MHPYHTHKLDFRFSPCVFLGYSYSHLSYYYLDLTSQRIFFFQMFPRHIRFHKQVFPFDKSE